MVVPVPFHAEWERYSSSVVWTLLVCPSPQRIKLFFHHCFFDQRLRVWVEGGKFRRKKNLLGPTDDYYSVPQVFVFFRRNSGLRAVLIFRRWSKYIKSAKFCAESDGAIGYFWKQLYRAAIQFLLIQRFRCRIEYRRYRRIDEKKLAHPSNQWQVLPFLYHRSKNISQNTPKLVKNHCGAQEERASVVRFFSYEKRRTKFRRSWFTT
jgi:hypothetical protein